MDITFWHWLGLAMGVLIIELLSGSGYLLCIALSAAVLAIIYWLAPQLSWAIGASLFAVISLTLALLWRRWLNRHPIETDAPLLNQRGKQYINREITLTSPIHDSYGTVHIDDGQWKIHCSEDLPVGTKVKIVDIDNVVLIVERI